MVGFEIDECVEGPKPSQEEDSVGGEEDLEEEEEEEGSDTQTPVDYSSPAGMHWYAPPPSAHQPVPYLYVGERFEFPITGADTRRSALFIAENLCRSHRWQLLILRNERRDAQASPYNHPRSETGGDAQESAWVWVGVFQPQPQLVWFV